MRRPDSRRQDPAPEFASPSEVREGDPASTDDRRGVTRPSISAGDDGLTTLFARYRGSRSLDLAEHIYRIATPRLRIYAATLLPDANDVDDVVQDAMLAVLDRPDSWDGVRPLLPWLAGVVRNLVMNRKRGERRRKSREGALSAVQSISVDPVNGSVAAEVFRVVESGIDELPSTYRTVLTYRLLHGATAGEIARELSRTENTVRVQLSRGLRMLRDRLPMGIGAAVAIALIPRAAEAAPVSTSSDALPPRIAARLVRRMPWRAAALAVVAVIVPVAVWLVLFPSGEMAPGESATGATSAPLMSVVAVAPDGPTVSGGAGRTAVAPNPLGSVDLEVLLEGAPAEHAPVSFQRIDDRGWIARRWVDHFGERTEVDVFGDDRADVVRRWTSSDGWVRFEAEAGSYIVRVPGQAGVIGLAADHASRGRIELGSGAAAFACQVRDAGGTPCTAEIWSGRDGPYSPLTQLCETDASGRFRGVLPRGAVVQARVGEAASQRVHVDRGGPELELLLEPAASLVGVVRGLDRRPLAGAIVEIGDGDPTTRVRTDARGTYSVPGVRPGLWRVIARDGELRRGYACSEVRIDGLGPTELDLDLAPTATVVGRITGPSGEPIPETVIHSGWTPYRLDSISAATDADGRFELRGVPPGVVRLAAGLAEEGFAHTTLELAAGGTGRWDVQLSPADLWVAGRVRGVPDGVPLTVSVDAADHFDPRTVNVTDGRFRLAVPPEWAGRKVNVRLFRTETLERLGLRSTMPIAVRRGVALGDQDVEIAVEGTVTAASSFTAGVVVPRGGYSGLIRLMHRGFGHWTEAAVVDQDQTSIDVRAEELPAGSYALVADGGVSIVEFALADGQHLDLGSVTWRDDRAVAASTPVELRFRHPGDATALDRLRVDVFGPSGDWQAGAWAMGAGGCWITRLSVPNGLVTVVASTATGLHVEAEVLVPATGHPSFEIPLASAREPGRVSRR